MNRLLGIVLDVEYLYTCVHKEEDPDTKQVYFSLFKVSESIGLTDWAHVATRCVCCSLSPGKKPIKKPVL